jgi:membrane-associated protease RseP (regulator of RpoE activity)
MDRAYQTIWTNPIDFRRTLELSTPENLRFVLEPTSGTSPPVEIPNFPEGLCLIGTPTPQILSVLKESPGAKAGFRGGDTILEIAGQPAGENLSDFISRYLSARETAAKKRADLRFKVRRASGETESLVLHVPPSWNSGFEE